MENATLTVKQLSSRGIRPGIQNTRTLLDRLSCPDDKLKIIHIAGTNGKGSTAEFFTQILIAAGKKVGTFTSPEVYDFYDQFRIDGKSISADKMEKYFACALKAAEGVGATSFEVQTAAVIYAFACEGCEYAVIECGMGGLNDATNAINKKELAVITSISLEHTEYLGATIEEICAQKAGIIKGNCPAVINCLQVAEEAINYFKSIGGYFANRITYADNSNDKVFWYCDREYELSVTGRWQVYNAATAIEGAHLLGLPEKAICDGIKNTEPFGRIQEIKAAGRTYILDGAHNPAAFQPLSCRIGSLPDKEITLIFGCLKDKDIDGVLSELAKTRITEITAVPCPNPRARSLEETASACAKYFKEVKTAQSVSAALNAAYTQTIVVCGSFTLLKEAKIWIEKKQ